MNYDLIINPCECCNTTLTYHILKTNHGKNGKQFVLMRGTTDDGCYINKDILLKIFGYDYEDLIIKNKNDLLKNLDRILKKYPNSYVKREDGNEFDLSYIKYLFKISNKTEARNYYLKYYTNSDYIVDLFLINNYLVKTRYFK